MSAKPRYALRVIESGHYAPADASTAGQLRGKHKVGDLVFAEFKKPRNPGFHRLAHQLGGMLAENLDAFEGVEAHAVLKRLQWEANVGCEEFGAQAPGLGAVSIRVPRSMSFESMDEVEFKQVITALCRHVAKTYWPTCTAEEVERMASCWVEDAA